MIIDVSAYQGDIDWSRVKSQIEGAIIRCGWGQDMTSQDDKKFKRNVEGCISNGIPFGVYLYSYAKSVSAAEGEARHIMRLCDPYKDKITLLVYYDLEENGTQSGAVDRARRWATILQQNGYKVGMYANSNWWKNYLKGLDEYPKWVANYGSNNGKPGTKPKNSGMVMWQYTSKGKVAGISGNVDCNLYYGDQPTPAPQPTPTPTTSRVTVTADLPLIKKGSKGKAVKVWQIIVGCNADGDFGPATEAATNKFQKAHNLAVDGIVGKNSWTQGLKTL